MVMAHFGEEIRSYTARISTTQARTGQVLLMTDSFSYSIQFHPEGASLPAPSSPMIGGRQHIYTHTYFDMFASVIDLLRNEKPVFATYRADTKSGMITTSAEPVGEGEGS
jgi:hypothetical protein